MEKMAMHNYKIVEFKGEKIRMKKSIDFVPANWINYDIELGDLTTKFMAPPYTSEDLDLLSSIIKSLAPPPDDWPKFCIDIIGEARTFDDAVKKLEIVEKERFAFSTDSEEHAAQKAFALKKAYRFKATHNDDDEVQKLLEVPALCSDMNENLVTALQCHENTFIENAALSSDSDIPFITHKSNHKKIGKSKETRRYNQEIIPDDILHSLFDMSNEKNAHRSTSIQFTQIQTALAEIKGLLTTLIETRKDPGLAMNQQTLNHNEEFATLHSISLPFEDFVEFQNFDEKLKLDSNMCAQLKLDVWPLIEPKSDLTRSVGNIIKKYMSRAVITKYTAVKKCPEKEVFKSTVFCKIIKEAIVHEYTKHPKNSPIKDKKFFDAIGTVINNAKDWEGQRQFRKKKPAKANEPTTSESTTTPDSV